MNNPYNEIHTFFSNIYFFNIQRIRIRMLKQKTGTFSVIISQLLRVVYMSKNQNVKCIVETHLVTERHRP